MATALTTEEQVEAAVEFLRRAGREAEARAVEALLTERRPGRRRPSPEAEEPVPIAEAARLLGTSRKGIQRRIESGWLVGVGDAENGYRFVTRGSLDRFLDEQRAMAVVAAPLGGLSELDRAADSQVARMFAEGLRQLTAMEQEEMAQEAAEDAATER